MKCPGQDTRYWNVDAVFDVKCPRCSSPVEFFKDDTTRKCGRCGHRCVNPKMDFGCAAYCRYAEQCLGDLPPALAARQEDLLKDRVAVAVKRHLKTDFKRIGHIVRRARHAEAMVRESQTDVKLPVVLITAFLWDLDPVKRDDREAPVARSILTDTNAPPSLIEQVCKILTLRNWSNAGGLEPELRIVAAAEEQACLEETANA